MRESVILGVWRLCKVGLSSAYPPYCGTIWKDK